MSDERIHMHRRRERAWRSVAWRMTIAQLDARSDPDVGYDARRLGWQRVFWFFEAARLYALGNLPRLSATEQREMMEQFASAPNAGWIHRRDQFKREARRQWREIMAAAQSNTEQGA